MTNDGRQNAPAEVQGADSSDKKATVPARGGIGASCHQGGGLTGFLKMAACCAGPILLLAAVPYFGGALGVTGASLLSTLALLACPAGMAFMMWRMSRQQAAVARQANPPVPLAENVLEEPGKEARS
ncbi:MAG: hypothetical protein AAB502_01880 [Chloroflexota bacterium]